MPERDNAAIIRHVLNSMESVIVGKREVAGMILLALLCRGHVLIEDVPGVGKTSLVTTLARSLNLSYRRIQFTPDVMPSDITGFSIYNQKTGEFEYREGLAMGQIVLADEINRTTPKTQSSLLEAMDERQVTVDGVLHPLPSPFIVLATQNPIEHLGTYPLPEAQLDRFFMKISVGYPSKNEECGILARFANDNPIERLTPVADAADVLAMQEGVRQVFVSPEVNRYIVDITSATRESRDVTLGVSPRGTLALMRASQGMAFVSGRSYVLPDDVKRMAPYVLPHRLSLKRESLLARVTPGQIVEACVAGAQVPVLNRI